MRRWLEVAAWVVLIGVLWGVDLLTKMSVPDETGLDTESFRLVSEQATSAVAALVMVLFVLQWLKLFPLRLDTWHRTVIGHTVGSILFAFGHFVCMVVLRAAWYGLAGYSYVWRQPFVANLIIEYQKDIKIYLGFVIVIAAYQYYCRTRLIVASTRAGRLIVQTGTGETVLRFEQIDYLEAARNYIAVHAEGREYVTRDTMTSAMKKLTGGPFVRTHRSFIVNIDKIREIRAVDSKRRILLHCGADVPVSRSYRDALSSAISG